jgi:hypothetical protein
MKRATIHIFEKFLPAWDVTGFLKQHGIDAKLVTRHAVQVHPDQVAQAKELLTRTEFTEHGPRAKGTKEQA